MKRELDHAVSSASMSFRGGGSSTFLSPAPSASGGSSSNNSSLNHSGSSGGSPSDRLLNKLSSDVTLTKCPAAEGIARGGGGHQVLGGGGELITTQLVRKRHRESGSSKQRDWPEKRTKTSSGMCVATKDDGRDNMHLCYHLTDWPSSSTAVPSNSSSLKSDGDLRSSPVRKTSAATLTISPTKSSGHLVSPHHPTHYGMSPVEVKKIEIEPVSPPYHQRTPPKMHGEASRIKLELPTC